MGTWKIVVDKLFKRLKSSGLLDACTELRVCILGPDVATAKEMLRHPKTRIVFESADTLLYERPTLLHLRDTADKEPPFYVFYFHSKGISTKNRLWAANIDDWIDMMLHFCVDKHTDCVSLLSTYDAIGANLIRANQGILDAHCGRRQSSKAWHFSGNFWWARSEYIKTLPSSIGPGYLEPEMWIGRGRGTLYSPFVSGICHYTRRFSREKYQNTKDAPVKVVVNG